MIKLYWFLAYIFAPIFIVIFTWDAGLAFGTGRTGLGFWNLFFAFLWIFMRFRLLAKYKSMKGIKS